MPGIQSTFDRWLEAPYQEGLWFDCSECSKRVDEGKEGVCVECLEAGEEEEMSFRPKKKYHIKVENGVLVNATLSQCDNCEQEDFTCDECGLCGACQEAVELGERCSADSEEEEDEL